MKKFLLLILLMYAQVGYADLSVKTYKILINEPDHYLYRCQVINNDTDAVYIYGTEHDTYCYGLAKVTKGYIAAGTSRPFEGNVFFLRLDKAGHELWRKVIKNTKYDEELYTVIETRDKGFAAGGIQENINGDGNYEDGYVIKINSIGKKLWDVAFKKKGVQKILALKENEEGILVAGISYDGTDENTDVWLGKVSTTGKILEYRVLKNIKYSEGQLQFVDMQGKTYIAIMTDNQKKLRLLKKLK